MAAAISCGVLGGGLVGLGTLGFDRSEVAAATCADNPMLPGPANGVGASPSAGAGTTETSPDTQLVTGDPVDQQMNTTASMPATPPVAEAMPAQFVEAAADEGSSGTTIAPLVGPKKKDGQGLPCTVAVWKAADSPDAAVVEEGKGESTTPATPETAEPAVDPATDPATDPTTEPETDPTTEPATEPATEPGATDESTTAPADKPSYVADDTTPNTPPAPSTGTGEAPAVLSDPVATVTQAVRGISLTSPPRTATPGRTGTISRQQAIIRAISWVNQRVMYSQSRWWRDANGTFRQDCSGFIAMAWRTDQRINYWTGNLGRISARIPSSSLKPGDILNLPGKHVVLFAGWSDVAKTRFDLFEQYRTGTPPRFVRNAALSYYLSRGYGAYRYEGIRDFIQVPPILPAPAATPTPTPLLRGAAEPANATKSGPAATIELTAASTAIAPASTYVGTVAESAVGDLLAGLPGTDWNPDLAASYVPEPDLAAAGSSDQLTPEAVADVPVDELVAAQAAIDQAEARRLAATGLSSLTPAQNPTSGAGYLLAGGLGLLFLAIPLAAGARGTMWAATSTCVPVPPRQDAT